MTGTGHVQIRCPVTGSVHLAHLSRWRHGVTRLDEQGRHSDLMPLRPIVPRAPLRGDVDPDLGVSVAAPTRTHPVERLEKILPGHGAELVVNLLRRTEFDGKGMQPRLP